MIRKFLPDIVSIVTIVLIVVLIAIWQYVRLDIRPHAVVQVPVQAKTSVETDQKSIFNLVVKDEALKKRNIFAETGSYIVTKKVADALAEESYTLLGILSGKERKAVIRNGQGVVTFCSVGKKMGKFVVASIGSTFVILKSEKETKELRIFNVQYKPPKR